MNSLKNPKTIKQVVFVFPFLFLAVCLQLKRMPNPTYYLMIQEDHILENLQFVFYFLASVWALLIAVRFSRTKRPFHSGMYGLLAFALFFTAGEEISWGLRIFHYIVPHYFRIHNIQQETTIHNLGAIQPRMVYVCMLVGFFGAFGWLLLKAAKGGLRSFFDWFIPDWFIGSYFLPTFLLNLYFWLGSCFVSHGIDAFPIGKFIIWRDQEATEFLQALGFMVFAIVIRNRQKTAGP